MSEQVTNYKCPACTGPLRYSASLGKLKCDYCDSTYEVAEIEAMYADKDAQAAQAAKDAEKAAEKEKADKEKEEKEKAAQAAADDTQQSWDTSGMKDDWGSETAGMKTYSCPSCGAELICDETTAATSCPYCGNTTVVPGQFTGGLKPDFVIPFKLNKKDAIKALKAHYKGRPFLPPSFVNGNHINEIKGVYVPFWMFDGEAEGHVSYKATTSTTYTSGDYEVTETKHYDVYRAGNLAFEKVPVDAATKMPDDYMDSIEPYDYSELKQFSAAYLPGYLADKYDVSVEECAGRADERCESTFEAALEDTVTGYDTCIAERKNIYLHRGKVHYALLPVWLLNTKWNGKDFLFAMNGQTGKMVGDLPMCWKKFWTTFAAIAAPLTILLTLFLM